MEHDSARVGFVRSAENFLAIIMVGSLPGIDGGVHPLLMGSLRDCACARLRRGDAAVDVGVSEDGEAQSGANGVPSAYQLYAFFK